MLGSKKTSVFVVDAKTGKIVRTFRSDNLPSMGERDAADETSIMTRADIEKWLPASSMDTEAVEKPLYVTRTDYALKYTSAKTGEVLWYLMFANIDASFQCEGIEDFLGGQRLDMKLSMPCQTRPVVYRIRDRSSLEPLFLANRVGDALPGGGVLSLPATDHNELDNLLAIYGSNGKELMLALPTPEREEFMMGSVPDNVAPQISGHVESDSIGHPQLWPSMLYSALLPIAMAVFYCLRRAIGKRKSMLHKRPEEFKLQNAMPKKKKGRKPVVNRHSNHGGKRHAHNSQDGVVEIIKEDATARLLPPNPSDSNGTIGRKIGRLVVTNKEIAKGSNGTIVLEGHYEGRSVAVKRLVRTHHDVAVKEIQNLIASDQHPNIVRWYGVEYDQYFVYLCLERCTCSLFDLITFCTSLNQVTTSDLSRESLIRSNMRLLNNLGSNEELELWKANGHPSALLLKLMSRPVSLLLLYAAAATAAAPTSSPTPTPTSSPKPPARSSPISSSSTLDPKQLRALQSLNIPTSKNPCTPPPPPRPSTATCDSSSPFRHLLSLTLANCSDDVALSLTALKSLSSLTSLNFINCPVTPIHFPPELTSNLRSFTCINSLKKLTGVWLSRLQNVTVLTVSRVSVAASGPTIILSGMKFLHSVTISQANLSGYLPKHWHPNLTSVDLSANHLRGNIPISLTRLENLVHLNLSSNSLNETIPTTIGDLSSLQNLSLASNSLSGPVPESLAALPALTHLDLSFNQLNGTIPDFIRDMKKLKFLNLASNNFHGVLPFNATFIKGLEVFKVGENSNLCYNHTVLGSKVKLGIAACDKHGLPLSPPPAKDSSADDGGDDDDGSDDYDDNVAEKKHHNGPSKIVLGVAIGLSSIVFLIVFLVLLSKCCK